MEAYTRYSRRFFEAIGPGAQRSAAASIPFVLSLVRPDSVLDVGCADGTWLAVFRALGVGRVVGVDYAYADDKMSISAECFRSADLEVPGSLAEVGRFDLTICLETAEHLEERRADSLVREIVESAPVIWFSAAVPGQLGIGHVNEQWPDYWIAKFGRHGFRMVDCLRWRFWDDERIEPWYAQNSFLFVASSRFSSLRGAADASARFPLRVVHPRVRPAARALLAGAREARSHDAPPAADAGR